jgi:hypothetical protein
MWVKVRFLNVVLVLIEAFYLFSMQLIMTRLVMLTEPDISINKRLKFIVHESPEFIWLIVHLKKNMASSSLIQSTSTQPALS